MRPGLVLAVFAILLSTSCGNDRDDGSGEGDGGPPVCTTCGACERAVTVTSANHVEGPINYPDPPPAGGDHNPCWAKWGPHTEAVPAENWVHNLEHGGVVVLYNCPDGCPDHADDLATLTALAKKLPQLLLTPYAALPETFAVVSWGHKLVSSCFDVGAAMTFYAHHVGKAPEGQLAADPPVECQ